MTTGLKIWESRVTGLTALVLCFFPMPAAADTKARSADGRSRIAANYGNLPLNFEENKGQTDGRVKFLSRGSGYAMFLTPEEAVLSLSRTDKEKTLRGSVVRMQFAGANGATQLRGEEPRTSVSNHFNSSDPKKWITGSRHYGRVVYTGLYPGVDAVFYGNQHQLEYDLVVAPGADPSIVKLRFSGADRVHIDASGALVLSTNIGELRQKAPVIYQEINGRRKLIGGHYVVNGNEVSFQVARYDTRKPLVIDPVLVYSTFLGGTAIDEGNAIAVDAAFNAYIVGRTESIDFPVTVGPFTALKGNADAFVVKLAPAGNTPLFMNYLGGAGVDYATGVAVDVEQNIYVAGVTDSTSGFPVTTSYQSSNGGGIDAFLVKFGAAGNFIAHGTYIGGFNRDVATGVAVDSTGAAYVSGTTESTNFDGTGGLRSAFSGPQGGSDGFLVKFNTDGSRAWGTYIGGSQNDTVNAVAVDANNDVYITGGTRSLGAPGSFGFPVTAGVVQPGLSTVAFFDAFATKINSAGTAFRYSTYLGGSVYDEGFGIAVDTDGNAYIVGDTESVNFVTLGGFQPATAGGRDAFIVKLNPTATARVYASYLGGAGNDSARAVALDSNRVAYITGSTPSANFPVNNFIFGTLRGTQDAFLVRVSAVGSSRLSSTYLGGSFDEEGRGVAVDTNGNAYLTGFTHSADFPVINALRGTFPGTRDAYVSKISNCEIALSPPSANVSAAAGAGTVFITGPSDCPWTAVSNDGFITLTGSLSGTGNGSVTFSYTGNTGSPRVGTIFIGGQTFTLNQEGAAIVGCVYPPNPTNIIAQAQGQSGTFIIPTATSNCPWTTIPNVNWIQVYPPTGTGQTTVAYTVYPNFSTLVRTGTVGIGSQTFNVTQAGNIFLNANQRFVALVYFNFLGRYPAQSEIDFQVNQLNSGLAKADLIMNFYGITEFNLGGRFIAGLYAGLLARDPEFSGWLFQRDALARGGITQNQLVANFLNSTEFQLKYGTLSDTAFIQRLYLNILGRPASNDEVAFQLPVLQSIGRVQMAVNFLNSQEFRARIDARMTAFLLYATLLLRDASPSELQTRQSQISTGTPVRTLVDQFINSLEFTNQLN